MLMIFKVAADPLKLKPPPLWLNQLNNKYYYALNIIFLREVVHSIQKEITEISYIQSVNG